METKTFIQATYFVGLQIKAFLSINLKEIKKDTENKM